MGQVQQPDIRVVGAVTGIGDRPLIGGNGGFPYASAPSQRAGLSGTIEPQELIAETGACSTGINEHADCRGRGQRKPCGRQPDILRDRKRFARGLQAHDVERLGEQRARLLADNIDLDQTAARLAEEIAQLEGAVNDMAASDSTMRESLRTGEEELKILRAAIDEIREKRSQIELDLVRKQSELKYLDETSRKELNTPVAELADADAPIPDADAIAEAEQSCNEVRAKTDAKGHYQLGGLPKSKEYRLWVYPGENSPYLSRGKVASGTVATVSCELIRRTM